jgi:prepilin-type N-terminal cleavage/methylation domain-containing protein
MKARQQILCHGFRGGFTLIELLVVIVIIGILAALAIPRLKDVRTRAKEMETATNLRDIQVAVESFGADHAGQYPFRMRWFDPSTYGAVSFDPYTATDNGDGMTSDADSYFSLGLFGGVRVVDAQFNSNIFMPEPGRIQRKGMTEHWVVQPNGWDESFYNIFNQYSDPLYALGYITSYPQNPFLRRPMGNILWSYGDANWQIGGDTEYDSHIPGADVVTTPGDFVYTHFYRVDNDASPPVIRDPEGVVEASLSYQSKSEAETYPGMYYLDTVDAYQMWAYGDIKLNGAWYVNYENNSLGLSAKGRQTATKDFDNSGQRDMYEIGMIAYYKGTGTAGSGARNTDGSRVEF